MDGVFFELPDTEIAGLPLELHGEHLNIGLVEIGCLQRRKRSQLKHKRELVHQFWEENYYGKYVDWFPEIYRTLGHYDCIDPHSSDKTYSVDTIIRCEYFPNDNPVNQDRVLERVSCTDLDGILSDNEKLYDLLVNNKETHYGSIRGNIAEVYIQQMIEDAIPEDILIHMNEELKLKSEHYPLGTEIDAIMLFYGESPYLKYVENLKKAPHLTIGQERI